MDVIKTKSDADKRIMLIQNQMNYVVARQKESDLLLYKGLQSELKNYKDDLHTCQLSDDRLRNLLRAAKQTHIVLPPTSNGTTTEIPGKSTSTARGMNCSDLQLTCTAWAEQYMQCAYIHNKLVDWHNEVSTQAANH